MSTDLRIDFETRSAVDLREAGMHRYAQDATTDAWCMGFAFVIDGKVQPCRMWSLGQPLPDDVRAHVEAGGRVIAFNAPFEHAIWNGVCVRKYGWPPLSVEQCECSAARCRALSLPGNLEGAAIALGLDVRKDMEGHRLMLQMCRPRKVIDGGCPTCRKLAPYHDCRTCGGTGDGYEWWGDPERRARLEQYCAQDVMTEGAVYDRTLALIPQERRVWIMDQHINNRGIMVDVPLVQRTLTLVQHVQQHLNATMDETTGGYVSACSNVNRLRDWVSAQLGYPGPLPSLDAATIDTMLALGAPVELPATPDDESDAETTDQDIPRKPLPDVVAQALQLRREAGKASTAKLNKMLAGVDADGRLRGLFIYHAAGPGRWAGSRVQPHNLPRPKLVKADKPEITVAMIDMALDIIRRAKPKDAMNLLWQSFGMPLTVIADLLRSMFIASPGHVIRVLDFSGIEARGVNWLFGQHDMLRQFRNKDAGEGEDLYVLEAKKVGSDSRQLGKVVTLGCGYQMGPRKFVITADGYGIPLALDDAKRIVSMWRESHSAIKSGWREMNDAAIAAVQQPGAEVMVRGKITFKKAGSFLFMRLPSGRCLSYPYPDVRPDTFEWNGETIDTLKLRYKGQDTRQGRMKAWGWINTYGGMLTENAVQALCRDLLAKAMLNCEANGYPVVMHVHDEAVTELPEGQGSLGEMEKFMVEQDAWADGLPIAVEGFEGTRYRK